MLNMEPKLWGITTISFNSPADVLEDVTSPPHATQELVRVLRVHGGFGEQIGQCFILRVHLLRDSLHLLKKPGY